MRYIFVDRFRYSGIFLGLKNLIKICQNKNLDKAEKLELASFFTRLHDTGYKPSITLIKMLGTR